MITQAAFIFIGVLGLILIAELIIKNSTKIAEHFQLSGTFMGLTVLSIGTSIPEIMTHIMGSINILVHPDNYNLMSGLLIGTNIGSDIFQQNFVLPLVGIIGTIVVLRKNLWSEVGALIIATVVIWLMSLNGLISRFEGLILVILYIAYLFYLKNGEISKTTKKYNKLERKELYLRILYLCVLFIVMAYAANVVLEASMIIVTQLDMSASFFGIIILGVSTALPELTTSIVAIKNGARKTSAGILIGSNVTNPLMGIGIGALISSYHVPNVVFFFDLPMKLITAFMILYFLRKEKLDKKNAIVLIGLFMLYIYLRQLYFPVDF